MNRTRAAAFGLFLLAGAVSAQAPTPAPAAAPVAIQVGNPPICLLAGKPPANMPYTVVKKIKLGKGSYGSVDQAIALMADRARGLHADAIIDYTGSQRFGFWPWRFVRPVVNGTAVRWSTPGAVDCAALEGSLR